MSDSNPPDPEASTRRFRRRFLLTPIVGIPILFSTLGGIVLLGAGGFIVGPMVVALFANVWHIYGDVSQDWLPEDRGHADHDEPLPA